MKFSFSTFLIVLSICVFLGCVPLCARELFIQLNRIVGLLKQKN